MSALPNALPGLQESMLDDQLMLAYAGGETAAFDALYERYESPLYRFIRRVLGIRFAAEVDEVFQETWARIVGERDGFSPADASWRVWAFTIAHNLSAERLRLSGREMSFYAHDEDGDGLEAAQILSRGLLGGDADGELAFWQAAGRRLQSCLDELSGEERAAFLLHHEQGFTVDVLAATLDVGADTVRTRLRQGLMKLRASMERYLSLLESADPGAAPVDTEVLHDVGLWRALEHAPDQNAVPDWRRRKAIVKRAHDAIGALDPEEAEAELQDAARSWWQTLGGKTAKRSHRRRNIAIAAVLLSVVAVAAWRRAPAPNPHADASPAISMPASTTAPTPSPPSPAAEALSNSLSTVPLPGLESKPPQASSAETIAMYPPDVSVAASSAPAPSRASPMPVPVAPPEPAAVPSAKPPRAATERAPPRPQATEVARPDARPQPAPPRAAEASPRPPPVEVPSPRPRKEEAVAAAPAPAVVPPPARGSSSSTVRTDETEPPTFTALSRWNRITISRRGGESRTLSRAEAGELNALLGSAALSAVGPRPMQGTPEWRVTLERNNDTLAVFEIGAAQVRWREGQTPSATGVPSAPALAALREALRTAVDAPVPAAVPPPRSTP